MKPKPYTVELFRYCRDCGAELFTEKAQKRRECSGRSACMERKVQLERQRVLAAERVHAEQREALMARAVRAEPYAGPGAPHAVGADVPPRPAWEGDSDALKILPLSCSEDRDHLSNFSIRTVFPEGTNPFTLP